MSPFSTNLTLSLKLVALSTCLCFTAISLLLPKLTTFAELLSHFASIFNLVASWLKPPYLYLVINFIIITILASSKLQSKFDHYAFSPPVISKSCSDDDLVNTVATVSSPLFDYGCVPESENVDVKLVVTKDNDYKDDCDVEEDSNCVKVLTNFTSSEKVISIGPAAASLMEFSKPPASSRIGHRKVVKSIPDHQGGKTLKVSKPKRQETLESTWKTITDGRPMPLTRHLRKSDTWENHPAHTTNALDSQDHSKMTKSETFSDCVIRKRNSSMLSRSSGPGKLKKDPSLSQDELNKRVEAFITKFNEDMRLQRQESLNQYMEMIHRGAGP